MKLLNISFLAIQRSEFDFLAYRHSIDSMLFCTMHADFDIRHLKLSEHGFNPENPAKNELFFEGANRFFHVPYRLCLYVKQQQPDIVIVHGFLFPFQLMALKLFMPAKAKLIVQHHAEQPFRNRIKLWMQRKAYRHADAYFFSSKVLANPFILKQVINPIKIIEVLESSTLLEARGKDAAREKLGLSVQASLFIWVGRLDENKDPLTVLKAFDAYLAHQSDARLYMFYHEDEGLEQVRDFINVNQLAGAVSLMGQVNQESLEIWYSACDFFLAGSHYESTGYALCEAMACGCIPVVTDIPAFNKISRNGEFAILFKPGDAGMLLEKLKSLKFIDKENFRTKVIAHFKAALSFEALSDQIKATINSLVQE